ncbi:MAG: amidase [Deltaproteobacteria bacterium]|nr:amidase [Deltaproteobacteria bacterium]
MDKIAFQPATDLIKAIRGRKLGSLELLDHYIERIEKFNPAINAVVATDFENARARARAADEALQKGENWGALHGLPLTIKDSFEVMGMPCTSGAPELKNHMPGRNAQVVQILIDEGAIIFGKTNLPLYAQDLQSYNEVYGQTNNPWDITRGPGGSSGGAAAALAAGLTSFEIGSDIGGSIRNPAHFCGVYGHKPTFAIVPLRGHIPPPPSDFSGYYTGDGDIAVAGPLARSAKDLDLLMDLIAVPGKQFNPAWKFRLPEPRKKNLKDYRIGLWLDDPAFPVDTKVIDCLQNTADQLAKAGAGVEDKRPDIDFARSHTIYHQLLTAAMSAATPSDIFEKLSNDVRNLSDEDWSPQARGLRGTVIPHANWMMLDGERLLMRQKWADFFEDFDVLLCPAIPVTAFPHDHGNFFDRLLVVNGDERSYFDTLLSWAGLTGLVYLPATVAPVGPAADGLPVGAQIVGPYLEDRTPIHVAELMEDVVGGFTPPPGFE